MSRMVNSLNTKFIACALASALTACDKAPVTTSAQAPQSAPDVRSSIVNKTNIVLPAKAPTGERFLSGLDLTKQYDKVTFCNNRKELGCESTEDMDVKTIDRISITRNSPTKLDSSQKSVYQNFFVFNQGINAPNPSLIIHFKHILSLEPTGVCTTKDQILSDLDGLTVEAFADIHNPDTGRYSFTGEKLDKMIEITKKSVKSTLGNVFCSHYVLNKNENTLTKYESVDGVIQNDTPTEVTALEKTPSNKLFLAPN